MGQTKKILVGSHISIAGGLDRVIERGESIGCTAIQIFTKSNRTFFSKKIPQETAEAFKKALKESTIESVVAHCAYLINIGSKTAATAKTSTKSLLAEVHRCELLKIPYLVIHPGSHTSLGEEKCIEQIAKNLDYVLERCTGKTSILLETMAGQGTNVGYTFEQLKAIRSLTSCKRKIGYCLDTCHIFAAGYDISTKKGYTETMEVFDKVLSLKKLKAIHMNDSQKPCGSRVDRHAPLGKGKIRLDAFRFIMNDKRLIGIPKILETPSDAAMRLWKREIKLLKSMVGG